MKQNVKVSLKSILKLNKMIKFLYGIMRAIFIFRNKINDYLGKKAKTWRDYSTDDLLLVFVSSNQRN